MSSPNNNASLSQDDDASSKLGSTSSISAGSRSLHQSSPFSAKPFPDPEVNELGGSKSYKSYSSTDNGDDGDTNNNQYFSRHRLNRSNTERPLLKHSSSDNTPLLTRTRRATESFIETANTRARAATITMINTANTFSKEAWVQVQRQRFLSSVLLGIFCMFLLNLIFLPRTSLDRDFRRLHGILLPYADVQRVFIQRLSSDTSNIRGYLSEYTTTVPHLAGDGYSLVEYTANQFEKFGFKTKIDTYETYLNRHIDNHLWLLDTDTNEILVDANLQEDSLDEDPTTSDKEKSIPAFHGYSASGNVTSSFIFANYGSKEDFAKLRANGVNTNGTIAIIRYGNLLRGLKVKFAQEYGCIGVVMYSDPYDDGDVTEENGYLPYPEGKARNPSSVQRGSVDYFTDQPGDPTTPGWSSTRFSKRTDPKDYIPQIPSIPVSFRTIQPFLQLLNGQGPDLAWKGNVRKYDYSPGPSPAGKEINLFNSQEYKITPIHNVIGEIKGVMGDEEIIIGNHRDAWIFGGAGDPNSGSAAIMEVARGFSELLKIGWKPLRTIKFISWDGEEYAMLGSTEFGEYYERSLQNKNLVYINVDTAVFGQDFRIASNPLFDAIIKAATRQIGYKNDPLYSLHEHWEDVSNTTIDSIGGGSDFTVFQNHLGIPSIDVAFASNATDAVYHYHSNYDSFHWMEKFIDPEFQLHSTLAQFVGLLTLQISEQEIVHVSTSNYAVKVYKYFLDLKEVIPNYWLNRMIDGMDNDPYVKEAIDKIGTEKIDLAGLIQFVEAQLSDLLNITQEFDLYISQLQRDILQDYPWFKYYIKIKLAIQIKIANKKIMALDRLFLVKEGLPTRPWMKHIVYAPDRDLGYASDCLPGLDESLRDDNYDLTVRWLSILASKVGGITTKLS